MGTVERPVVAVFCITVVIILSVLFFYCVPEAFTQQNGAADVVHLTIEGGKLPGVSFSHTVHADKEMIDCAVCHHKEPKTPQRCSGCHAINEAKDNTLSLKEVFHRQCIGCHEREKRKGNNIPVQRSDCEGCFEQQCAGCHKE